ncbi:COMM domain-containing protein 3 [Phytophthora cinnamomi]|uniref:COMM domain-containing protein 3 n=1 Tax=Phytophthora cinnamomi TaxID=4785 RepID=UPI003559ADFB|nr:COMM domain-containing protein 3 [Phytophthora cinnamomi]
MAGGFADDAAAFLEGDARVVPRRALDLLSTLSPASLQSLASAAASAMATDLAHSVDTHPNAAELPSPSDSEAFAAMCAIVATCARDGGARTPAEQRQQLFALGVEDDDLQLKLLPALAAAVPSVERVLENTSFDFAHVVDVSWRLDYVLRSSSAGSVHEPLYFVELKLQSPSTATQGLQTVAFTCSVEELRSLVYCIQEATNEVEKLAAGTPSHLRTST